MSKRIKIQDIKFDDKNFNKGSEIGLHLIDKSISKFGYRGAGVLDKNGVLVDGNKRTETAGALGFENVEIIKGDPDKIYHIQYDDIDLTTKKGRELALALNQSAAKSVNIDYDLELRS